MSKHVNTFQCMSTHVNACYHMSMHVNALKHVKLSTHVNMVYSGINREKSSFQTNGQADGETSARVC